METKTEYEARKPMDVTDRERGLLLLIRNEIPFGSLKVFTQHGQPVRYEEGIKSVVFDKSN